MDYEYNELKLEILMEMDATDEATAADIAESLGHPYQSVAMAMLRYHGQGLLDRYTTDWKNEKVYSLSARGLERLEWFIAQEDEKDAEDERGEENEEEDEHEDEEDEDEDDWDEK